MIQQKQEAIDEQVRGASDIKKEKERLDTEIKELSTLNEKLKVKLEEAQRTIEKDV